jgi:hypothetical protein
MPGKSIVVYTHLVKVGTPRDAWQKHCCLYSSCDGWYTERRPAKAFLSILILWWVVHRETPGRSIAVYTHLVMGGTSRDAWQKHCCLYSSCDGWYTERRPAKAFLSILILWWVVHRETPGRSIVVYTNLVMGGTSRDARQKHCCLYSSCDGWYIERCPVKALLSILILWWVVHRETTGKALLSILILWWVVHRETPGRSIAVYTHLVMGGTSRDAR